MMADRSLLHRSRVSVWNILCDAILLYSSLAGFFISFFSLYGDSTVLSQLALRSNALALFYDTYGMGWIAAFTLLLALLTLVVWSMPHFRVLIVGIFVSVTAGLAFYLRQDFASGALLTAQAIINLFADRVGWVASLDLQLGLTAAEELKAVQVFFLLAAAMLALLLGWAVVMVRRWWLVMLCTLPPLMPGLLSDVYPNWPFFLTLCTSWCAMLLADLCRDAPPSPRGRLTLLLFGTVGGLLTILFLLSPPEDWQRPQWTNSASDMLIDFGNQNLEFLSEIEGPFLSDDVTYVGSAESVDLTEAGPLRYNGRTVLKVTGDYSGSVFLRGASLANYEDGVWYTLQDGAYEEYAQNVASLGDGFSGSPMLFPADALGSGSPQYSVTVENTGASGSCIYAPYQLIDQDWTAAGVLPVEDSYLAHRRGQSSCTLTFTPPSGAIGTVRSQEMIRAEELYRAWVEQYYLESTDWAAQFVSEYLPSIDSVATGSEGGEQRAMAITIAKTVSDALAELCVYDPDVSAAPFGADPVEYFLTESQRGYCMHFASAAVLILRTRGIPARYVSGFVANLSAGQSVNVPDYAAHAWVEIYLDGYGWYPVDVTPDYATSDEQEGAGETEISTPIPFDQTIPPEQSDEPEATAGQNSTESSAGSEALSESEGGSAELQSKLLNALRSVAAVAATTVLLWLGQAIPKSIRAAHLLDPDANQAVLYGYRYLKMLEKWGGYVPGDALELAQMARFSQHSITEKERRAMIQMVDGERIWLRNSLKQPKKMIFHYWWGWPGREEESYRDNP